ncbi:MAG: hypothetical protein JW867_04655 [Candidatus Omnitrophica bacterium]|nr:hypothetical protein [Candidatus Omnitrophota bacterium]
MKTKIILLFFLIVFSLSSFAFDWKNIHDQSDSADLDDVLRKYEASPDSLEILYLLGLINLSLYKDDRAESFFIKMMKIEPDSFQAKWGVAEVLRRRHQVSQSQEILEEIIDSYPDYSPAYVSLAYIKFNQKNFNESVKLAVSVIKQGRKRVDSSNYARAHLIYAGAEGMIAHYSNPLAKIIHGARVMPNLKKAQSIKPDTAMVYFGLGTFYLLAPHIVGGDIEKASGYLHKTVEIDPNFADAYVRLAQVYKTKGDIKSYKSYLDKALLIDPQNVLANDIKTNTCDFICFGEN